MYKTQFLSRRTAGSELATKLKPIIVGEAIVLGMPGGGMAVANEVAKCLGAPLYPLLVRKLGVPGHDQLSMGAIAPDVQFLDRNMINKLGIAKSAVCKVVDKEQLELQHQKEGYQRKYGRIAVSGKTAVLVDEGIADDLNNIRVAVNSLRGQNPRQLLIAAPMVSAGAVKRLAGEGLHLIWLHMPDPFISIDHWYE